jgi:D-inositol-3-phosphate glycosyltransferase
VVRDGITGLLVDGHDPADYATAMAKVLAHPAYRARLGQAAARHALDFAWERTADHTLEVYRRAAVSLRHDAARREAVRG